MPARILALALVICACARAERETRIEPDHGTMRGGLDVRLSGADFAGHGPATIHVGETSAKQVVLESRWLIRFKTPPADEAGTVSLQVVFADGTTLELGDAFTYEPGDEVEVLTPDKLGGG